MANGVVRGAVSREDTALPVWLLMIGLVVLGWSAYGPHDYFTWFLEVVPALIGGGVLVATWQRFRFTNLVYVLILAHAVVLMVGGHYTYAEVPVGNWLRDVLHLSRNHYDRLGHFFQGFVPAMIVRELLVRTSPLRSGKWLFAVVASICMAISAMYELFEWAVAEATGQGAAAFLGTQGDPWDTQWDMFMCLCGALLSLLLLSRLQDRRLALR